MPPRSLTAPDGSIRTIHLEAKVSVDPGVLVGDYGLDRQGGRSDADARRFLDRGANRHEFDQTMADLGDVGLDADNVLRAQLIGFALEAIDRHFAGVVNNEIYCLALKQYSAGELVVPGKPGDFGHYVPQKTIATRRLTSPIGPGVCWTS